MGTERVYQMLSGQQPYRSDTPMGLAVKHITEPVPEILKVVPSLPAEVDVVIKNSMAKDRNKRYPTPTDLARNLHVSAFGYEDTVAPTAGSGKRSKQATTSGSPSRRGIGWVVTVGLLVAALAVGFLFRDQIAGLVAP